MMVSTFFANLRKPNEVKHGMYHITWKDGRKSDACIGSYPDGSRWLMCTDWFNGVDKLDLYWNNILLLAHIDMEE